MLIIAFALGYLIGMPILLRLIALLHKKQRVDKKMEKAGKSKEAIKRVPKPLWPKIKQRLRFTFKDTRPAQLGKTSLGVENRMLFFIFYGLGAAAFIGGGALGMWKLVPLGALIFFIAIIFSYKSSDKILKTQEKAIKRMFDIGRSKMGLSAEHEENPGAVLQVLEWQDYITPQRVQYQIPTTFGQDGCEAFLKLFNQNFGGETAWVPSDTDEVKYLTEDGQEISEKKAEALQKKGEKVKEEVTTIPGWNFREGVATFNAVPPLPKMAPWDEHYVINENIAWSFFPIALGVENGVELLNPKTGEMENVLGFDLSGEQEKLAEKKGIKVSGTIIASPMVFIGGGTGGGKSLSVDTPTNILRKRL